MLARKWPALIVSGAIIAVGLVWTPDRLPAQGYDTTLDEGGVDKRLDEGGVDKHLDEGGVDKRLDESGVDKDLDESGIDKHLDDSGIDNPAAAQEKPASSGPELIRVPESTSE